MAISWITAFKVIPWAEVLAATPAIVQGAEKLWGRIVKQEAQPARDGVDPRTAQLSPDARVRTLEMQLAELHQEVKTSTELIKSLAEQNLQLVGTVDRLLRRSRLLTGACVALGVMSALALIQAYG